MKSAQRLTYRDILNQLSNQSYTNQDVNFQQRFNSFAFPLSFIPVATYVVDYSTRQYRYIGENASQVMGHPVEAFWEGGLEFMLHHYHDFGITNTQMFPDEVNFLVQHPSISPDEVRFTKTYRFKKSDGTFNVILQQTTYCTLEGAKLPWAVLGLVWDITDVAEQGRLIHKIEYRDGHSCSWVLHSKKEYYPDSQPDQLLSKREIEILKWLADGYASKEIADKLCLSFNTVSTHRRNMLRKTNSRNTTELLRFAIDSRLL
jgi:DNA-binding CsgD family transcriptional regulator